MNGYISISAMYMITHMYLCTFMIIWGLMYMFFIIHKNIHVIICNVYISRSLRITSHHPCEVSKKKIIINIIHTYVGRDRTRTLRIRYTETLRPGHELTLFDPKVQDRVIHMRWESSCRWKWQSIDHRKILYRKRF